MNLGQEIKSIAAAILPSNIDPNDRWEVDTWLTCRIEELQALQRLLTWLEDTKNTPTKSDFCLVSKLARNLILENVKVTVTHKSR